MAIINRTIAALGAIVMIAAAAGCDVKNSEPPVRDTVRTVLAPGDTGMATGARRDPIAAITDSTALPVTLPLIDAFFTDSSFAADLKLKLGLTDQQVAQLRTAAHEETARLNEGATEEYDGTTAAARQLAAQRIQSIMGDVKALQLAGYLRQRWATGDTTAADAGMPMTPRGGNTLPTDTRVVVNAPAYRMDLFRDGKLVKSYRIGIGYPEFPLPTGTVRYASSVIFNPTWTPPDEPWVEGSSKVRAGKLVPAGSGLNPLGPIKIPIGLPSLIHGGKQPSRLGNFASHGCVGLTDPQIKDAAMRIAELGGTTIPDSTAAAYMKNKTETRSVPLAQPVPVELRYETIMVEDGTLHIYRDVYDQNTNTEDHLREVLAAYDVTPDQLTEDERAKVMSGLHEMSRNAYGKIDSTSADSTSPEATAAKKQPASGKVTKNLKGKKEIAIQIAALRGKGYPAPVNYDPSGMERVIASGSTRGAGGSENLATERR